MASAHQDAINMNSVGLRGLRDRNITTKIMIGFGLMGVVLVGSVGYTVFASRGVGQTVDRMITLRTPVAISSTQLVGNVYSTLATLRGYLLTGNPQGKLDRAAMWKVVDETISGFDKMASRFTNPDNQRKWSEAKVLLSEFRAAQDKVEASAFTPDAFPATKILVTEAAPRAELILGEITRMINEEQNLEASTERKRLLKSLADARGNFAISLSQVRLFLMSGDKGDKEKFGAPWAHFESALASVNAQKQLLTGTQNASFDAIQKAYKDFAVLPDRMFKIRESDAWNVPVYLLINEAAPRALKILDLLDGPKGPDGTRSGGIKTNQQAMLRQESEEVAAGMSWLAAVEWSLLAVGVFAAAALGFLISRIIAAPIRDMTTAMTALAGGKLDCEIPGQEGKDEIGEMARAVVVFRDAAIDKVRIEREVEQERVRSEEARRRSEAEAIDRERTMVSASIGAGMAKLASKELSFRLTDDLPEAYRQLQSDFNTAISELEAAMQNVRKSTESITSGAQEISTASDDLSRRTEQNAASLEETAAALEQITATVNKTAEGAKAARAVVSNAKTDAESGGDVVRKAVEAMGRIEKSSQQIDQIIGVIDEIAFQTNLLALNAGVEAARAGDAGRGFAVVASEVRALAQRSAEAAKEIKSLISTSATEVQDGVKLVAETGAALDRIVTKVSEINSVVSEIAISAQEQSTSLKQVNTAVNQMDQVTQQNAAMAEEATAASRSLAGESGQLATLVKQFRVGGIVDPLRAELQKIAPHAFREKNSPSITPAQPGRAGLRVQANRAAAMIERRVAVAGSQSDGWEEF